MSRLWILIPAILVVGCCLPPEREALRPLIETDKLLAYPDLIQRARLQAGAAVEAFYRDDWVELEQAAKVLEQTARILPRTTEQPAHLKDILAKQSDQFQQEAQKLGESARGKNVTSTTSALQSIFLSIRTLWVSEAKKDPPLSEKGD